MQNKQIFIAWNGKILLTVKRKFKKHIIFRIMAFWYCLIDLNRRGVKNEDG